MSLVSSMNIAQQGLSVNQAALTIVSNNIANMNTPGYSKLRVDQENIVNTTPSGGNPISQANASSGVNISSISRYSDNYLQSYYWSQNTSYSYWDTYSTVAANIEDLTNELNGSGLSKALTNFYLAANTLNDDPSDPTARGNYVAQAQAVADAFNTTAANLQEVKTTLAGDPSKPGTLENSDISDTVKEVNKLLDQLAAINSDIIKTNFNHSSSSALLDKRDNLITQLSNFIPIEVSENSNSTVNISLGNHKLLSGLKPSGYLSVASGDAANPAIVNIVDENGEILKSNINDSINSGKIGAILDVCGSAAGNLTVNSILKELDDLASQFASVMNSIQTQVGYPDGDGRTPMCMTSDGKALKISGSTNYMFVNGDSSILSASGITASNININSALVADPYLVAAARVSDPSDTSAVGDSSNMTLTISQRNKTYSELDNQTFETYMANVVSSVGAKVANVNNRHESQTLVVNEVKSKLSSVTGVNLDEELVDLIKYQRAYQASARVFSVCSELMETLVNLGR